MLIPSVAPIYKNTIPPIRIDRFRNILYDYTFPTILSNLSLAFRIGLIAHPEPDVLFRTETFKDSGFDDLTIGFTGNKHGILIDHEFLRRSSKLAEAPIDCLTGFLRVVFMILGIDA